ncbi:glycosyltransferase family 4 protein [Intrasporangium sp.]|uniref:glycosyltransferase family 4 protein n=1 Tax=Intrasporangium sp. TaxID=1925024 RepID=UPI0033659647
MEVTFLAWRDPWHPDGGGSEVYVEEVARRLVERGHTVTIRSAADPGRPARETIDGVAHVRRGGRLTVYLRGFAHVLSPRGRRADVVVDVINGVPFWSPLVRRRGVVALVHHVHREQWAIIYPNWKGRVGWFIESRLTPLLYQRVGFVTVSRHSADDLIGIGIKPSRITIVPNGLDQEVIRSGPGARSPTPRLVVLSRLVPHKQIEHALGVVARLRGEIPGLSLDIVGDGWWRDELVAESSRLGVNDLVTFHGHVPESQKQLLLARAWLMVLPSVKEGWGIAVTEAALQGTPTVGYASSGGLAESIEHGRTGLLVAEPSELVSATRSLLTDRITRDRLSVAARRRALELDWDATADGFEHALRGRIAVSGRRR